jgi:hypothetical protein
LAQQAGPAPPLDGILLLRNGQTFRGQITQLVDRYLVRIDGGEVSVRAADVEMVCHDLQEAYHRKRVRLQPDNINDRLEMVEWCQRQGLLGRAAEELAEAMTLDPNHPMIPVVERRLRLAMEQPAPAAQPGSPEERAASVAELDRLVRGMPPGTVENFTQSIQPILLNTCATSGCHSPGFGHGFALLRAPVGRPPSRRLTQRNLLAVLQWVNRSEPGTSPLLVTPTRTHGNARAPIFTDQQLAQYQELVDWVYHVTQVPSPVTLAKQHDQLRHPSHVVPASYEEPLNPQPAVAPAKPAGAQAARNRIKAHTPSGAAAAARSQRAQSVAAGAGQRESFATGPAAPADSFDPDIFNRRFAPANSPPPPTPPPSQ